MGIGGIAGNKIIFTTTHFSRNGGFLHEELEERLNPKDVSVAYEARDRTVATGHHLREKVYCCRTNISKVVVCKGFANIRQREFKSELRYINHADR